MRILNSLINPRSYWFGRCIVCGKPSIFLNRDKPENIRNNAFCMHCKSSSRERHLVRCILDEFHHKNIKRLKDFKRKQNIKILNTSAIGVIAKFLSDTKNVFCSEYLKGCKSGQYKKGILCQDLEDLSFEGNSLDLVITEDVFEHIKDYKKAFKEVHRVLKKGGKHIFTIPFFFGQKTKDLQQDKDEQIEYHYDRKGNKILAFTHFGYDLFDHLEKLGYQTTLRISTYEDSIRYNTFDCYTLVTEKI